MRWVSGPGSGLKSNPITAIQIESNYWRTSKPRVCDIFSARLSASMVCNLHYLQSGHGVHLYVLEGTVQAHGRQASYELSVPSLLGWPDLGCQQGHWNVLALLDRRPTASMVVLAAMFGVCLQHVLSHGITWYPVQGGLQPQSAGHFFLWPRQVSRSGHDQN